MYKENYLILAGLRNVRYKTHNLIVRTLVINVTIANKFKILVDNSQADFLSRSANFWLNTGIKVTLNAPETRIKNMKSGTVKATV